MDLRNIQKIYYKGNEINLVKNKDGIVWNHAYKWKRYSDKTSTNKRLKLQRASSDDIHFSHSGNWNTSAIATHSDSNGRYGFGLSDSLFSDSSFDDSPPMYLKTSGTSGKRLYHDNDSGDKAWFSFYKESSSSKFKIITENMLNSDKTKFTKGYEGYYVTKEFKGYFDRDGDFRSYDSGTIEAYRIIEKSSNTSHSKGDYIDIVESTDRNAYPDNGRSGSYWYEFIPQ